MSVKDNKPSYFAEFDSGITSTDATAPLASSVSESAEGSAESNKAGAAAIAALYVRTNGCYFNLQNVDAWDKKRDARKYPGPYPVVCHSPCQRWGKMWFGQPLAISKGVPKQKLGDDGGCFESALGNVRKYGGVLEHPRGSHAWKHFGLIKPDDEGGWTDPDDFGGRSCCVEQGNYGHYARKATWLYAVGVVFPELLWGLSTAKYDPIVVQRIGIKRTKRLGELGAKGGGKDSVIRISTPQKFRDLLIDIARSSRNGIITVNNMLSRHPATNHLIDALIHHVQSDVLDREFIAETLQGIKLATEKTPKHVDPDMPAEQLRWHMGELNAGEIRVARAAIRWANSVMGIKQ